MNAAKQQDVCEIQLLEGEEPHPVAARLQEAAAGLQIKPRLTGRGQIIRETFLKESAAGIQKKTWRQPAKTLAAQNPNFNIFSSITSF